MLYNDSDYIYIILKTITIGNEKKTVSNNIISVFHTLSNKPPYTTKAVS